MRFVREDALMELCIVFFIRYSILLEKAMIQFANSVTRGIFQRKGIMFWLGILLIVFNSIGVVGAQDATRQAELKPEVDQVFFNKKDLGGWYAKDMELWSIEDGAIVGTGGDAKIKGNQFLYSKIPVADFRLKLKVKQVPFTANAGIQFRSAELKSSGQAVGYQADVGKGWWGSLYHEHGRGMLARNADADGKNIHQEGWNEYEILAVDHRIWLAVNGQITVALEDPDGELTGLIALQIHGGPAQRVLYKDLELKHNPKMALAGLEEVALIKRLEPPEDSIKPVFKSPNGKPYPKHWGAPPILQTRDLRPLPGGHGQGSGTLVKWISWNLARDEKAKRKK